MLSGFSIVRQKRRSISRLRRLAGFDFKNAVAGLQIFVRYTLGRSYRSCLVLSAEFDVMLAHVRRDIAVLEKRQDPVDARSALFGFAPPGTLRSGALSSSVDQPLRGFGFGDKIATRLLRSMLTSEFKRASRSRMELLFDQGVTAVVTVDRVIANGPCQIIHSSKPASSSCSMVGPN